MGISRSADRREATPSHEGVIALFGDYATGGEPVKKIAAEWREAGFSVAATMAALDAGYFYPEDATEIDKLLTEYHNPQRGLWA